MSEGEASQFVVGLLLERERLADMEVRQSRRDTSPCISGSIQMRSDLR